MKIHYNNPFIGYYNNNKIKELLSKYFYWLNIKIDIRV